tara:strand:+ start:227 stop:745 length:519 start_codon:yes stop_codon:yes gene_type:complete
MAFNISASDILTLSNGKSYQGTVINIRECSIWFAIDDVSYTIPASDIHTVEFERISKRRAKKITEMLDTEENCFKGMSDGKLHGHKGGQFFAGFFGGALGFTIVGIVNRSPANSSGISKANENKELWVDLAYIQCYKKQSKQEALKMAGIGWSSRWVFILVVIPYAQDNIIW